ncbi:hypothetical protein [Terracidiphilus gabretensis]|jgi:hypothetical protein|uniref:hypothetical protein n=1 Tax=Terracidiphilus gabretensis TaxID=1577687 RepID=UPI00071BF251|nr:hypothetical protein [Terracidiphilus gabretensis]
METRATVEKSGALDTVMATVSPENIGSSVTPIVDDGALPERACANEEAAPDNCAKEDLWQAITVTMNKTRKAAAPPVRRLQKK